MKSTAYGKSQEWEWSHIRVMGGDSCQGDLRKETVLLGKFKNRNGQTGNSEKKGTASLDETRTEYV